MMYLRARQLKITISVYSPERGSRPDHHIEKDSGSRVRGSGSGYLIFRKVLSYHYGLTMFGNLEVFFFSLSLLSLCFVIIIKYSRAQRGTQAIIPLLLSLSVALELNSYFE